jgi:hypothetical protein
LVIAVVLCAAAHQRRKLSDCKLRRIGKAIGCLRRGCAKVKRFGSATEA